MDVACVIDLHQTENLFQRKSAFEDVKRACLSVNANSHHVQVKLKLFLEGF